MLLNDFIYPCSRCVISLKRSRVGNPALKWKIKEFSFGITSPFQQQIQDTDAMKLTSQVSLLTDTTEVGRRLLPDAVPFRLTQMYVSKITRCPDAFRHESGAARPWCVLDSCQRLVAGALVHSVCVPCVDCPQRTAQLQHRCRRPLSHPRRRTRTKSCGQGPASNHGRHLGRQMLWLRLCCTPLMPQEGR